MKKTIVITVTNSFQLKITAAAYNEPSSNNIILVRLR